jgi:putative flippase GtrA
LPRVAGLRLIADEDGFLDPVDLLFGPMRYVPALRRPPMHSSRRPVPVRILDQEAVRFVITGSAAALLFYLLTFAVVAVGVPPFAGTLLAYVTVLVGTYTVQHAWTFRGRQAHRRSFPRYLVAQAAAAMVASTVAHVCGLAGLPAAVLAACSTVSGSAVSFVMSKFWVFAPRFEPPARA